MLKLRPYQITGVKRLIKGNCLLADEMGVGKTVQVAVALRYLQPDKVLIVCPKSMINTWLEELAKWWPEGNFQKWNANYACVLKKPVVRLVTNYEQLPSISFSNLLVVDEAHKLKNRKTQRSSSCRYLAKKSELVWMLTGTPILNRADEIWHLLYCIAPKEFKSYWQFANSWCQTAPSRWSKSGIEILPGIRKGCEEAFSKMLEPYVLRRTKEEVGLQLPKVTRQEHWLDMTPEQAELHEAVLNQLLVEVEGGKELTVSNLLARTMFARRCAVSPLLLGAEDEGAKFSALSDLIEGTDDKIIVFSQWKDPLFAFAQRYPFKRDERGYPKQGGYWFLHGQMSESLRRSEIESWKQSKTKGVLFATLGTGGVGLTLVESSTAIFLDTDYVPANTEQAIARLDRIGQKRPVTVHFLFCKNSLEQAVYRAQGDKRKMIELVNEELRRLNDARK